MPRLLLFAATTGYQVRVFADAARRLGLDLALATDACRMLDDPWGDDAIPVRFHKPRESAKAVAAEGPFDGIVAVGDRPPLVAAETAALLGIPYHPPAAVRACHDKYLARQLYRDAGLPVPSFFRAPITEDARELARRTPYPCVLKPLNLSASRGVIRANDAAEFVAAFERIRALLGSPDVKVTREEQNRYLAVESYIPGREFAVEGLVTGGRLTTLALFDKPDPLDGPFFEETIYVTPSSQPQKVQEALIAAAQGAVTALGLTHGPVHAEMRYNDDGAWILEIGARPIGGLCARALRFDGGTPLEELIIRHALGEQIASSPWQKSQEPLTDVRGSVDSMCHRAATVRERFLPQVASPRLDGPASGVMMIPIPRAGLYQEASGVERAAQVAGIEDVIITAKQGQKLVPLPEGASYLGFIFARAETPAGVERALREAHQCLDFRIATVLETLSPSTSAGRNREEAPHPHQKSTAPSGR